LAQLYLGTSPGFRKVHVRPADEDAVFAVTFDSWEASAKPDDWLDKEILKLDPATVERIELPDAVLQRQDERWLVTGLGEQEATDPEAAKALVDTLAALRIQSLLGSEDKAAYRQDAPALELKLRGEGDDDLTYRFSKPEGEAHYVLKRSDLDYYFKVPEFSVEPLLETNRQSLVLAEVKQPAEEASAAATPEAASPAEATAQPE
jgi:hypothetical protein